MPGLKNRIKTAADIAILLGGCGLLYGLHVGMEALKWEFVIPCIVVILVVTVVDLCEQCRQREPTDKRQYPSDVTLVRQLILLNEQNMPVRSWDLSDRVAVVIGKKNTEEDVDVDLEDCEYSTFIDPCHAALNFCNNGWFVEDLGSQNGVKIKKVEDGDCYKVMNRPCRVAAGDIIYIANTKLLLS